jgi:hypothetical protein
MRESELPRRENIGIDDEVFKKDPWVRIQKRGIQES